MVLLRVKNFQFAFFLLVATLFLFPSVASAKVASVSMTPATMTPGSVSAYSLKFTVDAPLPGGSKVEFKIDEAFGWKSIMTIPSFQLDVNGHPQAMKPVDSTNVLDHFLQIFPHRFILTIAKNNPIPGNATVALLMGKGAEINNPIKPGVYGYSVSATAPNGTLIDMRSGAILVQDTTIAVGTGIISPTIFIQEQRKLEIQPQFVSKTVVDRSGDSKINKSDVQLFKTNFKAPGNSAFDFDGNGQVETRDISVLISNWTDTPPERKKPPIAHGPPLKEEKVVLHSMADDGGSGKFTVAYTQLAAAESRITVYVLMDTGATGVNAGEMDFYFDANKLTLSEINTEASVFTVWVQEPELIAPGQIHLIGGAPDAPTGSNMLLMQLDFDLVSGQTISADEFSFSEDPKLYLENGVRVQIVTFEEPVSLEEGTSTPNVSSGSVLPDAPPTTNDSSDSSQKSLDSSLPKTSEPASTKSTIPKSNSKTSKDDILETEQIELNPIHIDRKAVDISGDKKVNALDVGLFKQFFQLFANPAFDFDANGKVETRDLSVLVSNWTDPIPTRIASPVVSGPPLTEEKVVLRTMLEKQFSGSLSIASVHTALANDLLIVYVLMDTGLSGVNAAESSFLFDETVLTLRRIRTDASVFTVWAKEPELISPGRIHFVGAAPDAPSGTNLLVLQLEFEANKIDKSSFTTFSLSEDAKFYYKNAARVQNLSFEELTSYRIQEKSKPNLTPIILQPINKTILPPSVRSQTHPHEGRWYVSPLISLSWEHDPEHQDGDIYHVQVSKSIGPIVFEDEEKTQDGSILLTLKEHGRSYVHIARERHGEVSVPYVFEVAVDDKPPEPFEIHKGFFEPLPGSIGYLFSYHAIDETSGVVGYEIRVNGKTIKQTREESFVFDELKEGMYDVEVRAIDDAGNIRVEKISLTVGSPLPGMLIRIGIGLFILMISLYFINRHFRKPMKIV